MPHYVYILQSLKDNKYYVGETYYVEVRLAFHNAEKQHSTKNRIPFKLILAEEFEAKKQINSGKGGAAF